ncbi:MAG: TraB/GumN family protein, partial [Gammaproteobacteria bacterium]
GLFLGLFLGLHGAPLGAVPLWSVENAAADSRVLLLGSVHLLRAQDQPLPDAVQAAYRQAEQLLLELDPAELAPEPSRAALQRIGVTSPGGAAVEVLSAPQWRRAETLADAAGVDLQAVAGLEPWFAAIVLYTSRLAAAGYEAELGVDQQVAAWAARDAKPVTGLETLEEQLWLFKKLDTTVQRAMLLKAIEELPALEADTAALVRQWRAGDVAALSQRLAMDFRGYEELRNSIVIDRNRAWLSSIEARLATPGTYLVVVGALHLVGPEGLPALLEAQGYRVIRCRAACQPSDASAAP